MKLFVISDTHWNEKDGSPMRTHCKRPVNYTQLSLARWNQTVGPRDTVIHCGDVINGSKSKVKGILDSLNGLKILVRGNHDRDKPCRWWMENGFSFAADSFELRRVLFTHEPANALCRGMGRSYEESAFKDLPPDVEVNIHGHLHNVWDGFMDPERWERDKALLNIDYTKQLKNPWQRLFAVEYTDYRPVELEKFLANPDRYQARGPHVAA